MGHGAIPVKIIRKMFASGLCLSLIFALGCDKELKEHPLPASMKKKIQQESDPATLEKEVAGTVRIADTLTGEVPEGATLFIIARKPGETQGPPLAVRRHSFAKLPFEYSIGPAQVMLPGNTFDGDIELTVRLDQDGNAKPSPGDIEGTLSVKAGDKQADIVLSKKIEGVVKTITGSVRLGAGMEKNAPENATLFLIARPEGVNTGFPLAVKLERGVKLPYTFSLSQADVMLPGGEFDGRMTLIARLDSDGDAKPGPGDLEGHALAQAGDSGVDIVLDTPIPLE